MKNDRGIWFPDWDDHFHQTAGPKYQHELLKRAVDLTTSRHMAIDAGAHVGLWSRRLAVRFLEVLALEPHPDNFECLKANCNPFRNVWSIMAAAGEDDGLLHLEQDSRRNSGDFHIAEDGIEVEVLALDSLVSEASLIKVDVQGYELQVLQGATGIIERSHPVVIAEDRNGASCRYGVKEDAVACLMSDLGYKLAFHTKKDSVYVPQ